MKFPKYVDIYGQRVPVILVPNLKNEAGEELEGNTNGKFIWINSDEPKKNWKRTLLHEMWHCFIRRSGVIQDPNHNEALEEVEAEGLQNIIDDNFVYYPKNGEEI